MFQLHALQNGALFIVGLVSYFCLLYWILARPLKRGETWWPRLMGCLTFGIMPIIALILWPYPKATPGHAPAEKWLALGMCAGYVSVIILAVIALLRSDREPSRPTDSRSI